MDQGNAPDAPLSSTPMPAAERSPAESTTPPATNGAADRRALLAQAYLLDQLAPQGGTGETAAVLNRKITKTARYELGLTAKASNDLRAALAEQGYLVAIKEGRTVRYAITESGRTHLASLERPALSGRVKAATALEETAISDEIRKAQTAYLLLQLLDADGETLTKGDANRLIRRKLQTSLSLKPAAANLRRAKLAERGYLRIIPNGRSEEYALTPDGREYLAAGAEHLAHAVFEVKGKTLNALVAAARELPFQGPQHTEAEVVADAPPDKATLESAMLSEFEELRRERYGRCGLVPIHEVRQRIRQRFGPAAGRHEVLDEVILDLWRQKRLGVEGISDLSLATQAQLNDAIPGVSGPLFYLEAPREQPVSL